MATLVAVLVAALAASSACSVQVVPDRRSKTFSPLDPSVFPETAAASDHRFGGALVVAPHLETPPPAPAPTPNTESAEEPVNTSLYAPAHLTIATSDVQMTGSCSREIAIFCAGARPVYSRIADCLRRQMRAEDNHRSKHIEEVPTHPCCALCMLVV
jgi:hypothetical protein